MYFLSALNLVIRLLVSCAMALYVKRIIRLHLNCLKIQLEFMDATSFSISSYSYNRFWWNRKEIIAAPVEHLIFEVASSWFNAIALLLR